MELIVLDENLDTMGAIPLFSTLIWTRRYEKVGCFELYTSKSYFDLLNHGRYLYKNDAEELGIIEDINYVQDENGGIETCAKGYFSEKILEDRVIETTIALSGNVETEMRNLVTRTAILPYDIERTIKHLRLGDVYGILYQIKLQTTGDNLSEKLYEVGNTFEISHRIRYDYLTNDLLFEVWQGKDRRDSQTENSWAVFSNDFLNIRNVVYNRNSSSYKNFAYVAGEGEGSERIIVTVDLRQPGEERKEIWVDARDLRRQDDEGNEMPLEDYNAQLEQRGKGKLTQFRVIETINSNIDSHANLEYKKDFDLGDYCTYVNTEINVATDKRITEIMEIYEGGAMELSITFGNDEETRIRQVIKREV